ncbi:MAG: PD40 domain-containing protein [Chloroflexi bacterium]|nr:PD40 domain-containing protein [Chloroflexota bacterium]
MMSKGLAWGALLLTLLWGLLALAARALGAGQGGGVLAVATDGRGLHLVDVNLGIVAALRTPFAPDHFTLSPGGAQMAFSADNTLYLLDIDSGYLRSFSMPNSFFYGESWAPDGQQLAFVIAGGESSQIYVLRGGELRRLSQESWRDFAPAWSPDGRQIAFLSARGGWPQLFVMDADGSNARRLSGRHFIDYFRWSPAGDYIAYMVRTDVDTEIYSVRLADGVITNVSHSTARDGLFNWAPDGARLAFASLRDSGREQIFVVNADGSGLEALSDGSTFDMMPLWSPDGAALLYVCGERLRTLNLCLMNAQGRRPLDERLYNLSPAWSPDGRQIAFLSTRDGSLQLYVTDSEQGGVRRLTVDLPLLNMAPVWLP